MYLRVQEYPQYTTSLSQPSLECVTITHPHHPLHGQRCAVVRIRRGVDPDLILLLPDGSHAAIAMSSTDYGETPGHAHAPRGPELPLLDLQGLRQIVHLVDQLRQDGRVPQLRRRTRRSSVTQRKRRGNTSSLIATEEFCHGDAVLSFFTRSRVRPGVASARYRSSPPGHLGSRPDGLQLGQDAGCVCTTGGRG